MISNPKEKMEEIIKLLEEGKDIYICTHLKQTLVTKKTLEKFRKLGIPLFKVDERSLYIASGKKYVCIDYCQFHVVR